MLLTIIGLAILFIILVNVVLFCLETEAVGIIISIIGILGFLSGGHIGGIIVVIVGICLYNHAKETNEKAKKERSKKYFQQEMYKLVEQCWNSQTYDFNWKLWFDEKDAIFYGDSSLELKKTAQAELQSLGKAQINMLNIYLGLVTTEHRKDFAMKEIKAKEHIVLNLESIFSEPLNSAPNSLLREVHQYRQDLYDYVLYKRNPLNQAKLSSMIKRGQTIMSAIH